MRDLPLPTIGVRAQAVVMLAFVGLWHVALLFVHRQRENAPILWQALLFVLPFVTSLLSLIMLESRIRYRQPCGWWVYLVSGLGWVPWIWYAYECLSR